MKFNVPGKVLLQHMTAVAKVINSKNALSILENFLFKVVDDRLIITASDSDSVMTSWLEITEVDGEGEFCVNAKNLIDIVKEIGNQPVTFEINETLKVNITYLNGFIDMMAVDAAEYPRKSTDLEDDSRSFTLPSGMVTKGVDYTVYAVSTEPLRPQMTGVFWDIDVDRVTFVASDTHKLVKYVNAEGAPGFKGGFILPAKYAQIVRSVISDEDEVVNISIDSKGASFSVGQFTLVCKFIKGVYPNYNRVIPHDNPFRLIADRETLLNAVRRVSLAASKATSLIKIDISANSLNITSRDLDYATQGEENVNCNYEGNPMSIGFNSKYMLDILSHLTGDDVEILLADPARPGIYRPLEQTEKENITILQMPMQVIE